MACKKTGGLMNLPYKIATFRYSQVSIKRVSKIKEYARKLQKMLKEYDLPQIAFK